MEHTAHKHNLPNCLNNEFLLASQCHQSVSGASAPGGGGMDDEDLVGKGACIEIKY